MAKEYDIKVPAHKSIYSSNPKERELSIYFCEPEYGVNEDTGIVLFIAGFGGHANSNVYKKMRKEFADKYNLVTVQCDYFGYEFMQGSKRAKSITTNLGAIRNALNKADFEFVMRNGCISIDALLQVAGKYNNTFSFNAEADLSDENSDNFNDMGIMQAVDNLYAVLYVINILLDNNLQFNAKKIIIYGHSQGAYLAHFCNIMAPTLFNLIIDNSAWLYPGYINSNRCLTQAMSNNVCLSTSFDYYAKRNILDNNVYSLEWHYKKFINRCKIVSFHGVEDNLILSEVKRDFCNLVNNCSYMEISKDKVDGTIFRSCKHGLDADFLNLFEYALNEFAQNFEKNELIDLQDKVYLETKEYLYEINFKNVLPKINVYQKE